jgi:hypothetical protein
MAISKGTKANQAHQLKSILGNAAVIKKPLNAAQT